MTTNPLDLWTDYRADDPAHKQLQAFLVMDLQHSPEWIKEVLMQIEAVRSQNTKHWERLGNAYALNLTAEGAKIEDLVDESQPIHIVPLAEFEAAVQVWLQQIQNQ